MPGHDLPDHDKDETDDAVDKQRIRYNPTRQGKSSRLDTADNERIRYNPTKAATDDNDD